MRKREVNRNKKNVKPSKRRSEKRTRLERIYLSKLFSIIWNYIALYLQYLIHRINRKRKSFTHYIRQVKQNAIFQLTEAVHRIHLKGIRMMRRLRAFRRMSMMRTKEVCCLVEHRRKKFTRAASEFMQRLLLKTKELLLRLEFKAQVKTTDSTQYARALVRMLIAKSKNLAEKIDDKRKAHPVYQFVQSVFFTCQKKLHRAKARSIGCIKRVKLFFRSCLAYIKRQYRLVCRFKTSLLLKCKKQLRRMHQRIVKPILRTAKMYWRKSLQWTKRTFYTAPRACVLYGVSQCKKLGYRTQRISVHFLKGLRKTPQTVAYQLKHLFYSIPREFVHRIPLIYKNRVQRLQIAKTRFLKRIRKWASAAWSNTKNASVRFPAKCTEGVLLKCKALVHGLQLKMGRFVRRIRLTLQGIILKNKQQARRRLRLLRLHLHKCMASFTQHVAYKLDQLLYRLRLMGIRLLRRPRRASRFCTVWMKKVFYRTPRKGLKQVKLIYGEATHGMKLTKMRLLRRMRTIGHTATDVIRNIFYRTPRKLIHHILLAYENRAHRLQLIKYRFLRRIRACRRSVSAFIHQVACFPSALLRHAALRYKKITFSVHLARLRFLRRAHSFRDRISHSVRKAIYLTPRRWMRHAALAYEKRMLRLQQMRRSGMRRLRQLLRWAFLSIKEGIYLNVYCAIENTLSSCKRKLRRIARKVLENISLTISRPLRRIRLFRLRCIRGMRFFRHRAYLLLRIPMLSKRMSRLKISRMRFFRHLRILRLRFSSFLRKQVRLATQNDIHSIKATRQSPSFSWILLHSLRLKRQIRRNVSAGVDYISHLSILDWDWEKYIAHFYRKRHVVAACCLIAILLPMLFLKVVRNGIHSLFSPDSSQASFAKAKSHLNAESLLCMNDGPKLAYNLAAHDSSLPVLNQNSDSSSLRNVLMHLKEKSQPSSNQALLAAAQDLFGFGNPQKTNVSSDEDSHEWVPQRLFLRNTQETDDGFGDVRNYWTLDALVAPEFEPGKILPLIDVRWHEFSDERESNRFAANVGVMGRYIPKSHCRPIIGGNIYYDYRHSTIDKGWSRWGIGMEVLGKRWDFRLNGYFPLGKKLHMKKCTFDDFDGGFKMIQRKYEMMYTGFNAEIGCSAIVTKDWLLYLSAGPYYIKGACDFHAWGVGFGIRPQYKDYIALDLSVSHDHIFNTVYQGQIIFSLPLYSLGAQKDRQGPCGMSRRQIYQPVKRFDVIPVSRVCCWDQNF